MNSHKSGFVSIIGIPSVGKSTIINKIFDRKISITSKLPQTTRNKIQAIYDDESTQIIITDTPGIHTSKDKFSNQLNTNAISSLGECDLVLYVISLDQLKFEDWRANIEFIIEHSKKMCVVINKSDISDEKEITAFNEYLKMSYEFSDSIIMSANNINDVHDLLEMIKKHLNEGPKYYDDDFNIIINKHESFQISEIIREKVIKNVYNELPYKVAVVLEKIDKVKSCLEIHATLIVDSDSQKGMLIGKHASMIKKIGTDARKEIQAALECKINLQLYVKTSKKWTKSLSKMKEFGYVDE